MLKISCICAIFYLILSSFCFAQEIVTTKDGKKILLKNDHTWEYVSESTKSISNAATTPAKAVIKYASQAVEVWDTSLLHKEVDYSDAVCLFLHYKNNTDKKVIGVQVRVSIVNPFGKTVFVRTYDDEILLKPNERLKNDVYWIYKNNPYINNEVYDDLWQMAENGTAKIKTKILKVIFSDGTILTNK